MTPLQRFARRLGARPGKCPRCRSKRYEARTRLEKEYVAGEHQAHESTAGWVYGHREIAVRFRHCLDCGADYGERRAAVGEERARGSRSAKRFGGYGTE